MTTYKASEDGKQKIENAIKKMRSRYRCNLTSERWIVEANKVNKIDSETNEEYSIVASQASWKRFRLAKERIDEQVFNMYCKMLKLDPNEIAEKPSSIYGFIRLAESRSIFNDYLGERAIDELWADPFAIKHGGVTDSYIKVSVKSEEKAFLKVVFVTQGWGVNLTVRPMNDTPINASNFRHMKIKLRSPERKLIGIRVRVTDANNVCWGYGSSHLYYESKNLSTKSNTWSKDILISLDDKWFHFPYDGFPIKPSQSPDFKVIQLITFSVGFEPENTGDGRCSLTGFLLNPTSEGEIHISSVEFE